MQIALLNVIITVQTRDVSVDDIGNHISVWNDYYKCHATVSGESGNESSADGVTQAGVSLDLTMRWCKKLADIKADNARVIFNGDVYNITSIDHMNYKKKAIKVKCEKVRS